MPARAPSSSRSTRDFQEKLDLHIHLPEGATPKDGPSRGDHDGDRADLGPHPAAGPQRYAMTGEITLRGRVLAIGGLKERRSPRTGTVSAA